MPQPSATRHGLVDQCAEWLSLRPAVGLTLLVLAALGPFIGKPFNIDDPLFLWSAKHIQSHPLDPYGFDVNWYNAIEPMWRITKNPPLACYYIALAASIAGWSERALHCAFLLPAIAAILGTHRLARRLCMHPVFAACATLFTPVFLVSSTSVMCDTLMLAFWVWAVVWWMDGMERKKNLLLAASAMLLLFAALTKYFGACLIPLLAVYSVVLRKQIGSWALHLFIPATGLALYQWATFAKYGHSMFSAAGEYATNIGWSSGNSGALIALAFTGGCLATAFFFAPLLWRARTQIIFFAIIGTAAALYFNFGGIPQKYSQAAAISRPMLEAQLIFWAIGGASVLALTVVDVWQRRDASSLLLALWVIGTFLFAAYFNWVVNGRSILPMAPAVAILLSRRLENSAWKDAKNPPHGLAICFAAGAVMALLIARADFHYALAEQRIANETYARYGHEQGTLWFQGHWGWQYYIQELGAQPASAHQTVFKPGDLLAVPLNNTNVEEPDKKLAHARRALALQGPRYLATASQELGAGFYASAWGPLPFAFGRVPPEEILIYSFGPENEPARPN